MFYVMCEESIIIEKESVCLYKDLGREDPIQKTLQVRFVKCQNRNLTERFHNSAQN